LPRARLYRACLLTSPIHRKRHRNVICDALLARCIRRREGWVVELAIIGDGSVMAIGEIKLP
jgi:hypothetical protein